MADIAEVPQIVKQVLIYSDGTEKVVTYNELNRVWEEAPESEEESAEVAEAEVVAEVKAEAAPEVEVKEEVLDTPVEESAPEKVASEPTTFPRAEA